LESYIDRAVVESLVVSGRLELPPRPDVAYHAFVDPAGGSGKDSMTCAIAHKEFNGLTVLDCIREVRPPFSPQEVVAQFGAVFDAYNVTRIVGDHWGGLFVQEPFQPRQYVLSEETKSAIYRDGLALLNSRVVQLLDHSVFISQLCNLERSTGRGGKDTIDHPKNQHDDVCNAAMGAILLANNADRRRVRCRLSAAMDKSTMPIICIRNRRRREEESRTTMHRCTDALGAFPHESQRNI
jgi:hypothetical protein